MKKEKVQGKSKSELKLRIYRWVLCLVRFTDTLPNDRSSDVIAKQLIRSGTSVGANYVEAQAASSRKDFANFLLHSLKSANESKYWLAMLKDLKKGSGNEIEALLAEAIELANILGSSIITLRGGKSS